MAVTSDNRVRDLDIVRGALEAEYEVLQELGRGGMAIVYRARDRSLEREVAIKVLPFSMAFDQDLVERFQREAKTAAQLEHPHIIPIYRVGSTGTVSYFVMKLVRGESLSARLRREGALPAAEVRRILIETAGALGYAARHGVVHRDIKPDNIMLDEHGACVVTDFGIARSRAESKLTATGLTLGTPRYMSPEQARAKAVDGRSDLYSLGVVAYECLVGRPPFDGDEAFAILMDHINAPVPRPPLASEDDRVVYAAIERLLAKAPDDRLQSAEELEAALRTSSAPPPALTPTRAFVSIATAESEAGSGEPAVPSTPLPLDRGLELGLRAMQAQKQRLGAALTRGRALAKERKPGVEAAIRRVTARGADARRLLGRVHRRTWTTIAIGLGVTTVAWQGAELYTATRSRCPVPAVADSARSAGAASGFVLLLDPVADVSRNASLSVRYDVCGLDAGTPFTATASVSRNGLGGLKRLLGGDVKPVARSFPDEAKSGAVRRRESLDLDELPPGSYTLTVSVTDNRGRRRERAVEFRIRE